jgi:hypothetical protein
MLRRSYILEKSAILTFGLALSLGAQSQPGQTPPPSKSGAKAPPAGGQAAPAKQATSKTAPTAPAPAAKSAAQAPAKAPAVKPAPKAPSAKQAPAKAAAKPAIKKEHKEKPVAQKKEAEAPAQVVPAVHRRDPFQALLGTQTGAGIPVRLPPGKAGLVVSTLRVDGVVRGPNGMLVVVTNPQQRTYFLRQGDRLFDGRVEQISMDGVTFLETGKDPFGKPIERTVVKRIYATAGEQ